MVSAGPNSGDPQGSAPVKPSADRFFLSCDWGTTSFRLRLIDAETLETRAAIAGEDGILATYRAWTASGRPEEARLAFYLSNLRDHTGRLAREAGVPLEGVPLVLSGMASASIGMVQLPYKKLPFAIDGSDLPVSIVPASPSFDHPLAIVSGACTDSDVMRGEETLLVGALDRHTASTRECLVILPGTHSKHVIVREGRAVDFATYMTGEFFALLSQQSILSHTVEAGGTLEKAGNRGSFTRGVHDGAHGDLLRDCFSIRAGQLLDGPSAQANYFRLSGLLVGAELKGLLTRTSGEVMLVGGPALLPYYEIALQTLGPALRVSSCNADDALVRGQRSIALRAGLLRTDSSWARHHAPAD